MERAEWSKIEIESTFYVMCIEGKHFNKTQLIRPRSEMFTLIVAIS